jgi:hypothetical protein
VSGPVDVLAVLRTAKTFAPGGYEFREAGRAFAAVAELIEAAQEAFNAPDVMFTIASESEKLADRLAAALARVGGAA